MSERTHLYNTKADAIEADFWKYMEKTAIENGMRYCEDIN